MGNFPVGGDAAARLIGKFLGEYVALIQRHFRHLLRIEQRLVQVGQAALQIQQRGSRCAGIGLRGLRIPLRIEHQLVVMRDAGGMAAGVRDAGGHAGHQHQNPYIYGDRFERHAHTASPAHPASMYAGSSTSRIFRTYARFSRQAPADRTRMSATLPPQRR